MSLQRTFVTGLIAALPLLFTVGCAESKFDSESSGQRLSFAVSEDGDRPGESVEEGDEEKEYPLADCGKPGSKKVYVCHVPAGNPDARHTICVAKPGAENGHGLDLAKPDVIGGHGGDLLGSCEDLEEEESGCPEGGCPANSLARPAGQLQPIVN